MTEINPKTLLTHKTLEMQIETRVETMRKIAGKNQIRKFEGIAESLKSEIASYGGISGIVFSGGLVRGFADKYSDVDIIVLLNEKNQVLKRKIQKIGKDEQKHSQVDVDLEVHFLEDFKKRKWNETARWDFSHSEIVYDPQGKLRNLFRKKLKVSKSFWTKRIITYGEYVKWYCCPPQHDVGTMTEAWVDRGDILSAHYCLNYALSLLVKILFALNKEFLPPPKWAIFYSYHLRWLPPNYKELISETITIKRFCKPDLHRRLGAAKEMWQEILPKIAEETGLTPELISRHYVKNVLRQ